MTTPTELQKLRDRERKAWDEYYALSRRSHQAWQRYYELSLQLRAMRSSLSEPERIEDRR